MKAADDAMLLAWYDSKNNAGYPEVKECTGNKPDWLAYAESHRANLAVNINGGEFFFATELENQGG